MRDGEDMGDFYKEILVKRKNEGKNAILKGIMIAVTVLLVLSFAIFGIFSILAAVAMGIVCYVVFPGFDLEYEYLYVNGDIDVDKIMSKEKRKRCGSYNLEDLECIAPDGSDEVKNFQGKVYDYSSGEEGRNVYAAIYHEKEGNYMVKYEVDDSVIDDMWRRAPRKVVRRR